MFCAQHQCGIMGTAHYFCAPNLSWCQVWISTKCEWVPNVYLGQLFFCMKCQSMPNVNVYQMWVGAKSLYACTKLVLFFNVYLHPLFLCHEISECAQCECAWNVRVCPIWMCTKHQCAQCEMAPNVSGFWFTICMHLHLVCICAHYFFACGYFCAQIFRVHPMWMC